MKGTMTIQFFDEVSPSSFVPSSATYDSGKFVVVEHQGALHALLGSPLILGGEYYHEDLVRAAFKRPAIVLGGGYYEQEKRRWRLEGESGKYGPCSREVLKELRRSLNQHSKLGD